MSLESAWGNCGETAWKNNIKEKKKKTTTTQTESTEQRAHKRESRLPHKVPARNVKIDKKYQRNLSAHSNTHTHKHTRRRQLEYLSQKKVPQQD